MKKLIIEATDYSPKIYLDADKSVFSISGQSHTENSETFYKPIIAWFRDYQKFLLDSNSDKNITIEMQMEYYNSATARSFVELFNSLQKLASDKIKFQVKWMYAEHDEDMKTHGELMANIISELPFELICLKKTD